MSCWLREEVALARNSVNLDLRRLKERAAARLESGLGALALAEPGRPAMSGRTPFPGDPARRRLTDWSH